MMGALEALPGAVVLTVLEKLDAVSLCSTAATCRLLRLYVGVALSRLPFVHVPRDTCLNAQDLDSLLGKNASVQSLKLDCSRLEDNDGIDCMIKPSLEELALYNCDNLSSDLLAKIGQRCTLLRSLELDLGWQDDRARYFPFQNGGYSRGLELLLEGCSCLESLSLRFAGSCFDADSLAAIPRLRAGSIQTLDIGFMAERDAKLLLEGTANDINRPATAPAQNAYLNLQKLSLSLDRISDGLVATICLRLPTLTDLDLRDEPIEQPLLAFDLTNIGVQHVGACSSLRRLSLVRKQDWFPAYFKRVSDLGIFLMAESCKSLDSIRLGGFSRITDAGCRALLHASLKLQTFEVLHMSQVTDLAFHDLSATSLSLECVCLTSCSLLTDDAVAALALCKGIRTLNLNGCRSVGDEGLKAISSLSQLQSLSLNGADVSDHGLYWLSVGCLPLAFLSLRGCQRVTERGIYVLLDGNIVNTLESLDLSAISYLSDNITKAIVGSRVRLTELWLRDCLLLTNLSVSLLAKSSCGDTLRMLDLWGCMRLDWQVVSGGWFHKPHFPRLHWLGVSWTVTGNGAKYLKKARPSVRIRRNGSEFNDWWSAGDPSKAEVEPPDYHDNL